MKSRATFRTGLAVLAAIVLVSAGCDEFNKAFDDLTTQDVEFYQGIYNGSPTRSPVSLLIAKNESLAPLGAGPVEVNSVEVWGIAENILAMQTGAEEVVIGLSGSFSNGGSTAGRVYVFFAPTSAPSESEAVMIGSFFINAGQNLTFSGSQGFDQTPEEVQANIKTYFDANPTREVFHVFLYCENAADPAPSGVVANYLNLDSTPAFSWLNFIPSDFLSGSSDNIKNILSVNVSGTFVNLGDAPARFVWVVGPGDENLTTGEDLIIDIWVNPGNTADAAKGLVVPEGLRKLKSYLKDMVDGASVKGNLAVVSDSDVNVKITDFRVELVAEVGL